MTKHSHEALQHHSEIDTCLICKASGSNLMEVKETGSGKFERFKYLLCDNCGSLTLQEIPTNLFEYYENYYSYNTFDSSSNVSLRDRIRYLIYSNPILYSLFHRCYKSIYEYNLKSILRIRPDKKSKILDVGCGSGKFVFDLRNLGYTQAIGIDPFLEKDIIYPNGSQVFKKNISEVDEKFDLITFHHTLEHFDSLIEVPELLSQLLEKDGICIVRIPNIDSYSFKYFREYWTGVHAPYHINLPSQASFSSLLEKGGLEIYDSYGEQTLGFLLSNVESKLNLIDPSTMFVNFQRNIHTLFDKIYWLSKRNGIRKNPNLCEWLTYYIRRKDYLAN